MSHIEYNTKLLIQAAERGDAVEVQRLIPISDPKSRDSQAFNMALQCAAFNGHIKCVKLLIPVSDPKIHNSTALQMAARNGHTQCVELLYPVSDPHAALHQLQQDCPDNVDSWEELERRIAQEQSQKLNDAVGETAHAKNGRRM